MTILVSVLIMLWLCGFAFVVALIFVGGGAARDD
jgi:hypothetical protein